MAKQVAPKKKSAAKKSAARRPAPVAARKGKPAPKASASAKRPPSVADYMTRSPHTIGRDQTLKHAHELMNQHRIRHLPVLEGGNLVGVVSQRDLYFVESLDSARPEEVLVEEAMSQDVFETTADASLREVAETMHREKHGCAVVTRGGRVIGVFSTIDALKALLEYVPG